MKWTAEASLPIRFARIEMDQLKVTAAKTGYEQLELCAADYRRVFEGHSIGDIHGVQVARQFFRAIGIDPTKRRTSSEALLRRALKGKELFSVNTLVDTGNWCSLDFLLPVAIYDHNAINGDVTLRLGTKDDEYLALNHQLMNFHGRYVFVDESGAFGSPITDSQRTAVSCQTTAAILILFASRDFEAQTLYAKANLFADRVLEICGGKVLSIEFH